MNIEQYMQRSPAFIFADARAARDFGDWVKTHFDEIKAVVKAVSAVPQVKVAQALTAVPDAPAHP